MFGRRKSWKGWSGPFVMSAAHGERELQAHMHEKHIWTVNIDMISQNTSQKYYFFLIK